MDIVYNFREKAITSDEVVRDTETDIIISKIKRLDDVGESFFEEMKYFSSRQKTK